MEDISDHFHAVHEGLAARESQTAALNCNNCGNPYVIPEAEQRVLDAFAALKIGVNECGPPSRMGKPVILSSCEYPGMHSDDDFEALRIAARDLNDWLTGPTPTEAITAHVEQGERLRLALAAQLARWET